MAFDVLLYETPCIMPAQQDLLDCNKKEESKPGANHDPVGDWHSLGAVLIIPERKRLTVKR